MKRFAIIAITAILATTGAAWAEKSVTVMTPKDPVTKEQAEHYVAKLEQAVKRVCAKAAAPVVGVNFYTYQTCLKDTRAELAAREPTGLYAGRDSAAGTVVAAR